MKNPFYFIEGWEGDVICQLSKFSAINKFQKPICELSVENLSSICSRPHYLTQSSPPQRRPLSGNGRHRHQEKSFTKSHVLRMTAIRRIAAVCIHHSYQEHPPSPKPLHSNSRDLSPIYSLTPPTPNPPLISTIFIHPLSFCKRAAAGQKAVTCWCLKARA